jgi:hypothetical protein
VFFEFDDTGAQQLERLWVPIARPQTVTPELVTDVAAAFNALSAFTQDALLVAQTRGRRAFQRARELTPEGLRGYLPQAPAETEATDLPQLLLPDEYDRRRAPEGVFWLNHWSRDIVAWIGEDRVRSAPWARADEQPGGGLFLAATVHPLDPASPADRELVAELLRTLDIRDAQERCRQPA